MFHINCTIIGYGEDNIKAVGPYPFTKELPNSAPRETDEFRKQLISMSKGSKDPFLNKYVFLLTFSLTSF